MRYILIVLLVCSAPSCDFARDMSMMSRLRSESQMDIATVGILIYDGFFELDAFGPQSVLSNLMGTEVFFVAKEQGLIKSSSGIEVMASKSFDDVAALDILVVPGGSTGTVAASKDNETLQWIKDIHANSTFTTSVCTGAWILGEAGILTDRCATTNWYRAEEKLTQYDAHFVSERWVKDGKVWTSAGVSAGIDMCLALIHEIKGETYTKLAMLNLEYDPQPPIVGGSVDNTDPDLVEAMSRMYDKVLK